MNTFLDHIIESYKIEELQEICDHGCQSGCAGTMIYYSQTNDLYDQFAHELHDRLGQWIDETGQTPDYITKELGSASTFKNAMVWLIAEIYANEIVDRVGEKA